MSDQDLKNLLENADEETLRKLNSRLEDPETTYIRHMLSKTLGIDMDKITAFVNEELSRRAEQNEPESTSDSDLLVCDMFNAQDSNGLDSTYKTSEFNIGSVITIMGVEFFKAAVPHDDHTHAMWIDVMGGMLSNDDMAELARGANADYNGTVTKIIHFG